ncbi:hypothetical protein ACQV2X_05005 [Facklamia sp. P12945]|uniref:hypothetical protein n=1 Tax=unclassified Facklamia TaxID=2622293 RepID=UPI003D185F84
MGSYLIMFEQRKYAVIQSVAQGRKSKARAQVELGLTRRSISRRLTVYKTDGKLGFQHGNEVIGFAYLSGFYKAFLPQATLLSI